MLALRYSMDSVILAPERGNQPHQQNQIQTLLTRQSVILLLAHFGLRGRESICMSLLKRSFTGDYYELNHTQVLYIVQQNDLGKAPASYAANRLLQK